MDLLNRSKAPWTFDVSNCWAKSNDVKPKDTLPHGRGKSYQINSSLASRFPKGFLSLSNQSDSVGPTSLGAEQPLEQDRVDDPTKPHLVIDLDHRHLLVESSPQRFIVVDVHQFEVKPEPTLKLLKQRDGLMAAAALLARVDPNAQM